MFQRKVVNEWNDIFIFKVYDFAKGGMKDRRIAKALHIPFRIFMNWKRDISIFKTVITRGQKLYPSLLKKCIESGKIEIFSPSSSRGKIKEICGIDINSLSFSLEEKNLLLSKIRKVKQIESKVI